MSETTNTNETFEIVLNSIKENKNVPAEFKDEFAVFEMISENNKFDELNGETVQPLSFFFNEEQFIDEETNELRTDIKTYMVAQLADNSVKMFNGFSYTFRISAQNYLKVLGSTMPKIQILKESKGAKQRYRFKPIRKNK